MKMTQTANAIFSFLLFVIFCHILSDRHLVSGQAYHFSKGWMPGKRTNILLQPGQFEGAQKLDGLSEEELNTENGGHTDDYDEQQRLDLIEDMIAEPTANGGEDNNEEENMTRLRTLLRTIPRIASLSSPSQSSAFLPYSSSSYSHTPPQCQIRPHLTRLIETLLNKEQRRIASACPTDTTNLRKLRQFNRLLTHLLASLEEEN